ncbi:MAG TPA: TerC family protein [Beijerinckiaceae bacterium]|nr:TerC family protein [Beijerinckiaceae bacterium]
MFDWIFSPEALAALAALTALEILLGIDNVIFISVLVSRLPREQGEIVRKLGLLLAFLIRIILLFAIATLLKLSQPVLTLFGSVFSWRDIILVAGGLFLIVKATHEMHLELEGGDHLVADGRKPRAFGAAVAQVAVIDLVFSVDSIVTAIGMTRILPVMVTAVAISMLVMWLAAGPVAAWLIRHPTTKMLALAFLLLIGVVLFMEGFGQVIDRRLIYVAMAFALAIELINLRAGSNRQRPRRKRRSVPPPAVLQSGPEARNSDEARS